MNFFAICASGKKAILFRIKVSSDAQKELASAFEQQAREFLDPILDRVKFASLYNVNAEEVFMIENFDLPAEILSAALKPDSIPELKLGKANLPHVKAIIGTKVDDETEKPTIYFQAFKRTRLLVNKLTLIFLRGTFNFLEETGLTLDNKLTAVFEDDDLFFRSFPAVSGFLDMSRHFHEATDQEVTSVLDSKLFVVENKDEVVQHVDKQMRKMFWAVEQSGVLERLDVTECHLKAADFDLELKLKGKGEKRQIVFPTEKKDQKTLLAILTEGLYFGVLTGNRYKSNSHRPYGAKAAPARKRKTAKSKQR